MDSRPLQQPTDSFTIRPSNHQTCNGFWKSISQWRLDTGSYYESDDFSGPNVYYPTWKSPSLVTKAFLKNGSPMNLDLFFPGVTQRKAKLYILQSISVSMNKSLGCNLRVQPKRWRSRVDFNQLHLPEFNLTYFFVAGFRTETPSTRTIQLVRKSLQDSSDAINLYNYNINHNQHTYLYRYTCIMILLYHNVEDIYIYVRLSIYLSIHLSIHPSVYPQHLSGFQRWGGIGKIALPPVTLSGIHLDQQNSHGITPYESQENITGVLKGFRSNKIDISEKKIWWSNTLRHHNNLWKYQLDLDDAKRATGNNWHIYIYKAKATVNPNALQ